MATLAPEVQLKYVLCVLKHTELPQPDYHAVAQEQGITDANTAQKKLKAIIESVGFALQNRQVVDPNGPAGDPTTPAKATKAKKVSTPKAPKTPKTPRTKSATSAKKRKVDKMAGSDNDENGDGNGDVKNGNNGVDENIEDED